VAELRQHLGAVIRHSGVIGGRGFVTENHTIVIVPDPAKRQLLPLQMVCRLLNTMAVDGRFRRISGSVSVSTTLRDLPVPAAADVRRFFKTQKHSDDEAAVAAYAASVARAQVPNKKKAVKPPKGRRHP